LLLLLSRSALRFVPLFLFGAALALIILWILLLGWRLVGVCLDQLESPLARQ
jgi:hypothetical protein